MSLHRLSIKISEDEYAHLEKKKKKIIASFNSIIRGLIQKDIEKDRRAK
jgi:predicted CopG family antitoxin